MLDKKIYIRSHQKIKYPLPTLATVPKPDIFINVGDTVFPLHRSIVGESELIAKLDPSKKVALISQNLDIKVVERVMLFYYGHEIEVKRVEDLYKLFQVIRALKLCKLQKLLINTLTEDIRQHNVFTIIQFSNQFLLENLARLCLSYLQEQEFEQAKYHQYGLYQCEFILFQIIIRRHHILKAKNKINGLSVEFVEWLISNYCRRHQIPEDIKEQLYNKYINSWAQGRKYESIKSSAKMQKPVGKGIGQSTTIYGNDSEKRQKQEFQQTPPQKIFTPIRARKFSVQIEQQLQLNGLNYQSQPEVQINFFSSVETEQPIRQSIQQQTLKKSKQKQNTLKRVKSKSKQKSGVLRRLKSEQDELIEHIQSLGLGYSFNLQRKNHQIVISEPKHAKTKSLIFHEVIQQEVQQSIDIKKRHHRRQSKVIEQPNFGFSIGYK